MQAHLGALHQGVANIQIDFLSAIFTNTKSTRLLFSTDAMHFFCAVAFTLFDLIFHIVFLPKYFLQAGKNISSKCKNLKKNLFDFFASCYIIICMKTFNPRTNGDIIQNKFQIQNFVCHNFTCFGGNFLLIHNFCHAFLSTCQRVGVQHVSNNQWRILY